MRGDGVGNEEGSTSERSRISRPWREGRWKTQSHGLCEGVVDPVMNSESSALRLRKIEGGRPLPALGAATTADPGRISWASLKAVRVEANTEVEASEEYVALRRR
jgi:hypothetical protein